MSDRLERPERIVIIGGGLAGAHAAEELRTRGYDGELTLIGAEDQPPYERPPLSKDLLLGDLDPDHPDTIYPHDTDWYAEQRIQLLTGTEVTGIDLAGRTVTAGDRQLGYDRLLLATGARPRRLPMVDEAGAEAAYLRTLADSRSLKQQLTADASILIIGGGWIGLEVAAAARKAEARVTVVESQAQPLLGVLGPELAEVFAGLHREHGVDLRLETQVEEITRAEGRTTVRLSDGEELHPDLIVVGVGVEPVDDLARTAGLETDGGILVDAALRSSDPHVFAAGDVARHDHPRHGAIRVEHWDTAIQHGKHVAASLLDTSGEPAPYDREPYFFTDQYDLGMEYVGHVGKQGYDEVVIRGDRDSRVLTALWLADGKVAAGMHLNDWDATDHLRTWVGRAATDELRDTSIALADLTPPQDQEGAAS